MNNQNIINERPIAWREDRSGWGGRMHILEVGARRVKVIEQNASKFQVKVRNPQDEHRCWMGEFSSLNKAKAKALEWLILGHPVELREAEEAAAGGQQ